MTNTGKPKNKKIGGSWQIRRQKPVLWRATLRTTLQLHTTNAVWKEKFVTVERSPDELGALPL